MRQYPCVGLWRRRKGGLVPIAQANRHAPQSPRLLAEILRERRPLPRASGHHAKLAGAGTRPASCGRPITRTFYASISALYGALSASRARARAPASHRVWHAIWGPARACNKVRAGTDRTGFASKSLRIRRDPPTRFAPDLGSRRV